MQADTRTDAAYGKLLDYLLVLPVAHVRFQDFLWQHAVYGLFHQRWPARLSHAVGMAPNTFSLIAFASLVPLGPVDGGLVLAALLLGLYLWNDRLVGLVLAPVLAGMWLLARALIGSWGDAALGNLAIFAVVMATIQASGHAVEPVPPPWTGTTRFEPFLAWARRSSPLRVVVFVATMLPLGILMEYWAAPRLLPAQAMYVLGWLGYRPEFRTASRARADYWGRDIREAVANHPPPANT